MPAILLISAVSEDLAFATQVAKTADCELIHATTAGKGVELFQSSSPKFLMLDGSNLKTYQELETEIHNKIGLFSELIQPNNIHFIASDTFDKLDYLTKSPLFGHLIYRKFDHLEKSAEIYGRVLATTQKEKAYGLGNFLRPGTKIQTIKLSSSNQKQSAVTALNTYLTQAKFQQRMATLISNAVDEILMNSIFDAPVDDLGKNLYTNTPRSTVLKLDGKNAVELQVGFDGEYAGITAIDYYGSLDKAKLLSHVSKNYTDSQYKIKIAQAGAALGLATVYQNGGSFFFASGAGERTEVSVFFKRTDSYVEFKNQFRFFSTQFYF